MNDLLVRLFDQVSGVTEDFPVEEGFRPRDIIDVQREYKILQRTGTCEITIRGFDEKRRLVRVVIEGSMDHPVIQQIDKWAREHAPY